MSTLQSQIIQLHQSLVENFKILRSENDEIFSRLEKIEKSLDKEKEDPAKDPAKEIKTLKVDLLLAFEEEGVTGINDKTSLIGIMAKSLVKLLND